MSELYSIVIKPSRDKLVDRYNRVRQSEANLIADHGIEGDVRSGGTKSRQLNIMSYEMLETLKGEGFHTEPGEMGEQMIIRGVEVDALKQGDRLRIGADAVIEITKPRTGCEKFEAVQNKSPSLVENRMGMMARVVTGGTIREGDKVFVLVKETE